MREITVYVDVPFCNSKCTFCAYVAHVKSSDLVRQDDRYADYVTTLKKQIRGYARELASDGYAVNTIFFGGGTPTALSADQLIDILNEIRQCLPLSEHFRDTTIETTPENVTEAFGFDRLRRAGFDRVSMGVQSMVDQRLRAIGRCHTNQHVHDAVATLRAAGFTSINVDLLLGVPGESDDELAESIERGLELGVNHYSTYVYMPFQGTVMKDFRQEGVTSERLEAKYAMVKGMMETRGYSEYMCQYFSRDTTRCVCDYVYFGLMNEWIGFGSNAESLWKQHVSRGPLDYKKYIENPWLRGEWQRARESSRFVTYHYHWALLSELGLDFARFEASLGISFEDALAAFPAIKRWHSYLEEQDLLHRDSRGMQFKTSAGKAHHVCKWIELAYAAADGQRKPLAMAAGH